MMFFNIIIYIYIYTYIYIDTCIADDPQTILSSYYLHYLTTSLRHRSFIVFNQLALPGRLDR